MTPEHDRLIAALFDRPGREHIDVKFFLATHSDGTNEDFCADAANFIDKIHNDEGCDETFAEDFEDRPVAEFLAQH